MIAAATGLTGCAFGDEAMSGSGRLSGRTIDGAGEAGIAAALLTAGAGEAGGSGTWTTSGGN